MFSALKLSFVMDLETIIYRRKVYTFWEFCGEIGGLIEISAIFGSILVTIANFISGNNLDGYLISKLFYFVREN